MFRPVTKWNARIERPEAVPEIVRKAFRVARLEKPGATHIELPEDVAAEPVEGEPMPVRRTTYPRARDEIVEQAAEIIRRAERPMVLAGNGVVRREAAGHQAADALRQFVECSGIPVTHTFMGKGALAADHPLALPAVGLQRPSAELVGLDRADVVVAVGYDLVEWGPSHWNPGRHKTIIHVDSTAAEIDGAYLPAIEVVGEIGDSLRALAEACNPSTGSGQASSAGSGQAPSMEEGKAFQAPDWLQPNPADLAREEQASYARDDAMPMKPQRVVADLRAALGDDDILLSDVGAHKLWIARFFPANRPNTVVIANGFASMGIALPGALAAKLVHPDRRVVAVTGDGGFLMNVQELETARRIGTPFVVVVLVDNRYGVIELNQQRRFGRSFGVEFGNPDPVQLASAFGLPGFIIEAADELLPTLRRAMDLESPSLIAVPVDAGENVHLLERLG
jgi:acetolactate synthase-1/2/3 large subunit